MHRRRLLDNNGVQYTVIDWAKCNGVCSINTGVVPDSSTVSIGTEFKMKTSSSLPSSGHMIAYSQGAGLQVYTTTVSSQYRIYNQGAWGPVGTNRVVSVETSTTRTLRTLTYNGTYTSQSFTRDFTRDGTDIVLFSTLAKGAPCDEIFNYFNVLVNGVYVRKYVFVKDSNSVIHLLDTLTNTIYSNSGTGYFSEYNS